MRVQALAMRRAAEAFWSRLRGRPNPHARGIGLALGGGFARGVAHIGVLRVLEREKIPVRWIAGVSAGSIVAAGYAGGADSHHLEDVARHMKFKDVAGWGISKLGLVDSSKMEDFLRRAFPVHRFEEMRIPLAVVATDLRSGAPVVFQGSGEIFSPVRASCSYPGLFRPVRYNGRFLVDGAISMEVPAAALRDLGAAHVVSVALPPATIAAEPSSMFGVVNRCFQIMQRRTEESWRAASDLVIEPAVSSIGWDDFSQVDLLMEEGMKAAENALPRIRAWANAPAVAATGSPESSLA